MNDRGPTNRVGRQLAEALAAPIFACDATGRLIEFNAAFAEMFDAPVKPAAGMSVDDLFDPRIGSFIKDNVSRILQDSAAGPWVTRVPDFDGRDAARDPLAPLTEITFVPAGDGECVALIQASALPVLVEGPFRKRIPFFALAENMRDVVFMTDPKGVVNYASPAVRQLTGAGAEAVVGKPLISFFHHEDRGEMGALFAEASDGLSGFRDGMRIFHEDGRILRLTISMTTMSTRDGSFAGAIGVARDTTREYKLEQRLERTRNLEMMRNLAEGIAGDFNNILTGIMGNMSLLRAMVPKGDLLWGPLGRVEQSTERAVRLTQQLIACARGGRGMPQSLNVNDQIRRTVEQHEICHDAEIVIRLSLAEPAGIIYADPAYIRQVLDNLLQNAWEATPGGGTVTISTGREVVKTGQMSELGPGEYVRIVVEDTGVGIDEENLGRIFEPFFTTKSMRRGLGLTAVHGIVTSLDGAIDVQNAPDGGAIFTVLIPIVGGRTFSRDEDRPRPLDLSILVIDDEKVVRDFCQVALTSVGARVTTAESGEEGIQLFRENPDKYDVVLLDLVLSDTSGERVYEELRRVKSDVRVVLSSGFPNAIDDARDPERFQGALDLLVKPFDLQKLIAILTRPPSDDES